MTVNIYLFIYLDIFRYCNYTFSIKLYIITPVSRCQLFLYIFIFLPPLVALGVLTLIDDSSPDITKSDCGWLSPIEYTAQLSTRDNHVANNQHPVTTLVLPRVPCA